MPWRAGIGANIAGGHDRCSVHQPDRGLTAVVLPQDIGLAVAVEILCALYMPCGAEIGADIGAAQEPCSIHQPDCGLTAVVLQQDVGLAVAVEISGAPD